MPVFLEKFVLPVLAAFMLTVILLNPLKLDKPQRISLAIAVLAIAYFVGHTLERSKATPAKSIDPVSAAPRSGAATTSGDQSPAQTGDGNTVEYGVSHPREKKAPKKKSAR